MKAIRRADWLCGIGKLCETDTAIAFEMTAIRPADRRRRDGGQFVVAIGFMKRAKVDMQTAQTFGTLE